MCRTELLNDVCIEWEAARDASVEMAGRPEEEFWNEKAGALVARWRGALSLLTGAVHDGVMPYKLGGQD